MRKNRSTTPSADDPYSALLIPSSDLTSLLADPDLRSRYPDARYVPGKNVSLCFPAWTVPISSCVNSLAQRCDPHSSRSIIAAISLHIGIRAISSWDETERLKEILESVRDTPTSVASNAIQRVIETLQPQVVGEPKKRRGEPRRPNDTLVVSKVTNNEFVDLVSATGITDRILIPYCMMVTLSEQPKKYMNKEFRAEMAKNVAGLRKWLSLRAEAVKLAITTFQV